MSQENVEISRRFNEAFNRGDMAAVLRFLDPGFEWWDRADDPGATVYRGRDAYSKHLAEIGDDVVELQVELKEVIDAGDYVVAAVRVNGRGRASGAPFEEHEAHVLRLHGGKATELREYRTVAEALEAVGLSEQDARLGSESAKKFIPPQPELLRGEGEPRGYCPRCRTPSQRF